MLYPLLLRALPQEMVLNYHRSQAEAQPDLCTSSTDGSSSAGSATEHLTALTTLLRYFRRELESQERALEHRPDNSIGKPAFHYDREKVKPQRSNCRPSSAAALHGSAVNVECQICGSTDHESRECSSNLDLSEKKAILSAKGICFRCTKKGHIARECRVRIACKRCNRQHATSMCNPAFASAQREKDTETRPKEQVIPCPVEQVKETLRELSLPLGDDSIEQDATIDVLIGSDQFWECLTRRIRKINSKLTAMETVFGWAVQGPTVSKCKAVNCAQVVVLRSSVTDQQTEPIPRLFSELEGVGVSDTPEKLPNVQIMEEFTKGIKTLGGRYEVRLPEREDVAVEDNHSVSEETWPIEQQFENFMPDELDQKRVQTFVFPIELRSTENRTKMPSNSPLKEFMLTTDSDGLRIRGRICSRNMTHDERHPVVLPRQHRHTELLPVYPSKMLVVLAGFPGVLGCIDGTYVETRCPAHKIASTYTNRHDKKSYNVQAICDSDKKFVDVFLGNTGKTHDSEAFRDPYPLREYLLTPFRDCGTITPEENEYNLRHSKTRVCIENAFGLLKGRFRQLLYLEFWSVERATLFILACCVLYNLCIDAGDTELVDDDTGCSQNARKPNPNELLVREDQKRQKVLRRLGYSAWSPQEIRLQAVISGFYLSEFFGVFLFNGLDVGGPVMVALMRLPFLHCLKSILTLLWRFVDAKDVFNVHGYGPPHSFLIFEKLHGAYTFEVLVVFVQ
ncbi:hypothetical protein HPB50_026620 [Hyalomma asiaticum]|uniref:Uncharacterized protein n=1 Tax=Hyalomma asiaticum TaxID=266040 RepID=A0ACB7TRS1_HYAAI|nr:hypothetical protein HPB50_026620 [Hyalomma asiaticum]